MKNKRDDEGVAILPRVHEAAIVEILHTIHDVVWSVSVEPLRLLFINQTVERLYGYDMASFYQNPMLWSTLIHPEDYPRVIAAQSNLEQGGFLELEYRIIHKTGKIVYVRDRTWAIVDENGKVVRQNGIVTDISHAKKIENDLSRQTQLLQDIVQTQREMICRFTVDTTIVYANDAYRNHFKWNRADITGCKIADRIQGDDIAFLLSKINEVVSTRKMVTYEYPFEFESGERVWQEWVNYPILDEFGKVVEIQSVGLDITERVVSRNQVKELENLIRSVVDNPSLNIVLIDRSYRLLMFNEFFEKTAGAYRNCSVEVGMPYLKFVPESSHAEFTELLEQAFRGETIHTTIRFTTEVDAEHVYSYLFSMAPVADAQGNITRLSIYSSDITQEYDFQKLQFDTNSKLKAIIDNSDDLIYSIDINRKLVTYNEAFKISMQHFIGDDEITGSDALKFAPAEILADWEQYYQRVLSGERFTLEWQYPSDRFFLLSMNPIFDFNGVVIGATVFNKDITTVKQSQRVISEQTQDLKFASKIAQLGYFEFDWNSAAWKLSDMVFELLELPKTEVKDASFFLSVLSNKVKIKLLRTYHESVKLGTDFEMELEVQLKSGNRKWLNLVGRFAFDEYINAKRVRGTIQDITAAKLAELRILQNEANLKTILDNTSDQIWSINLNYDFIAINAEVKRVLFEKYGIPVHEQKSLMDARIHPYYRERYRELVSQAAQGQHVVSEIEFGANILEVSLHPIIEEGVVTGITCISRDISQRKAAEIEQEQNLKRQQLLTNFSEMVYKGHEHFSTAIYDAFAEIGAPLEFQSLQLVRCETPTIHWSNSDSAFALPPASEEDWQRWEHYFKTEGDKWVMYQFSTHHFASAFKSFIYPNAAIIPVFAQQKMIGLWVAQPQNASFKYSPQYIEFFKTAANLIADRYLKTLYYEDMRKAKDEAERAARVKSEFLSVMSHEIRTPLNGIIGVSQLLSQANSPEMQNELIQALTYSANNLMVLINDVLDYSKIDAGKIELEQAPFNLREMIDGIHALFLPKASEKNINFEVLFDPQIPTIIQGDRIRIGQILNNLVSNAIKFTHHGFVKLVVRLVMQQVSDLRLHFEVIDSGVGIPAAAVSKIFDSFTQVNQHHQQRQQGTGLGLAISQKLVALHGEQLLVDSHPGEGSRFYFQLTLKFQNKPQINNETQAKARFVFEKPVHVLVVDDNPVNLMITQSFIERWGGKITLAEHGEQALQRFNPEQHQLVIMDLQMPVMDGYEAARHLLHMYPNIIILALTADAMPDTYAKVKEAGMRDVITKPFDPEQLFKMIVLYT